MVERDGSGSGEGGSEGCGSFFYWFDLRFGIFCLKSLPSYDDRSLLLRVTTYFWTVSYMRKPRITICCGHFSSVIIC